MKEIMLIPCLLLGASVMLCANAAYAQSASRLFGGPINAALLDKESVAIVVPTNEADKDVEEQIHSLAHAIRDRFFGSEAPVITDVEALQKDLSSNSLMVYGTLTGNLWLAKHIQALPVEILPDRIVTAEATAGTDLRFITCCPNPQNPQKGMVIYTAQQAKDIVKINNVFHGPTDYVVARGTEVLLSGGYRKEEGEWTFAGRDLALEAALADLDFFFRTVESVHPQPLAHVAPQDYVELKRRTKARLEEAAAEEGKVLKSVLAVAIAEAAAFLKDGHTTSSLSPDLLDREDPTKRMLPFRLEYRYGDIVVGETLDGLEHLRGHRLVAINDVATVEFIRPILDKLSGERTAFKMRGFMHDQRVYWALIPLTAERELTVTVADEDGQTERLKVDLLSVEEYDRNVPKSSPRPRDSFYEFHHGGKTCYWQYNSFIYSDGDKQNVDSLFAALREKAAENLVIDLRFNGGGSSPAGDYILDYLTSEPYRQFSKADVRLSKQALEMGHETAPKELEELLVTRRFDPRQPEDRADRFGGSLFLITGPDSFSSAVSFAAAVKDYNMGTIIGEETGGVRQCFGDQLRFQCPNTGVGFGVSYKRFGAPIPQPDDDVRGVLPDVPVSDEVLADYADADDPALAFALDYVAAIKRDEHR
ncbi:MAG: S41 family peptidase [Planctomycetota bacterium]|jgi:hypothetical protein